MASKNKNRRARRGSSPSSYLRGTFSSEKNVGEGKAQETSCERNIIKALESEYNKLQNEHESLSKRLANSNAELNRSRFDAARLSKSLETEKKSNELLQKKLEKSLEQKATIRKLKSELEVSTERLRSLLTSSMIEAENERAKVEQADIFFHRLGQQGEDFLDKSEPPKNFPTFQAVDKTGSIRRTEFEKLNSRLKVAVIDNKKLKAKLETAMDEISNIKASNKERIGRAQNLLVSKQNQLNGSLRRIKYLLEERETFTIGSQKKDSYIKTLELKIIDLTQSLNKAKQDNIIPPISTDELETIDQIEPNLCSPKKNKNQVPGRMKNMKQGTPPNSLDKLFNYEYRYETPSIRESREKMALELSSLSPKSDRNRSKIRVNWDTIYCQDKFGIHEDNQTGSYFGESDFGLDEEAKSMDLYNIQDFKTQASQDTESHFDLSSINLEDSPAQQSHVDFGMKDNDFNATNRKNSLSIKTVANRTKQINKNFFSQLKSIQSPTGSSKKSNTIDLGNQNYSDCEEEEKQSISAVSNTSSRTSFSRFKNGKSSLIQASKKLNNIIRTLPRRASINIPKSRQEEINNFSASPENVRSQQAIF